MAHIDDAVMDRLLSTDHDADVVLCWHGAMTRIRTGAGGRGHAVVRLVGHLDAGLPAGAVVPEEFCFVVDVPVSAAGLMKISDLISDSMEGLTTDALESLLKDGGP